MRSQFISSAILVMTAFASLGIAKTTTTKSTTSQTTTSIDCAKTLTPKNGAPVLAEGYTAKLVAANLTKPRSILFDTNGHLLVVAVGRGVVNIQFDDGGGTCLNVLNQKTVIDDGKLNLGLNHGLALSNDGRTLYASGPDRVHAWSYDPEQISVSAQSRVIVRNLNGTDHTTRTLELSKKKNNTLIVSRGSLSNFDYGTLNISTGRSQVRAFDLSTVPDGGYDYDSAGRVLGWGLRNSEGIAEHPITGGVWAVENSADEITRKKRKIEQDNPAEELNYLGLITDTETGGNYGYPLCLAAWNVSTIQDPGNLTVGAQFVVDGPNTTIDDDFCARNYIPPRLSFQAHMAPIDIKFTADASQAFISFHGSWDRTFPVGYKVSLISFSNGNPTAPSTSTTAATDILSNPDLSKCPEACFRPTGLVFDSTGRLFVASDATGEIFVVAKQGTNGPGAVSGPGSATGTASAAIPSKSTGVAAGWSGIGSGGAALVAAGVLGALVI
ncbi:MAG: hypothetical protein M1824_003159 [Vezdaea acicularis]|nr:MAG: hypothetical protein M1824_003159 [Vezdaea acicularis]